MNFVNSIILGLLSGAAQFLPISESAHNKLFLMFSGIDQIHPMQMLLIHIGCIFAILTNFRHLMDSVLKKPKQHKRGNFSSSSEIYDLRLTKSAAFALIISLAVFLLLSLPSDNKIVLMILLVVNGIVLYAPERMLKGNKDARHMSVLDSYLMGSVGAMTVFPGISGIGFMYSAATARGADSKNAFKWAIVLVFYTLCALSIFDVISLVSYTGEAFKIIHIVYWIISGLFAYLGSCAAIYLIRFLSVRSGISGFAYYSWGAALLVFFIYLTVA